MNNSTGTAPARASSDGTPEHPQNDQPQPVFPPEVRSWHVGPGSPHEPPLRVEISEDLRVPWDWPEVGLFVVLAITASAAVTWGMALVAIRLFGLSSSQIFGPTMSTAKSIVVLISQAVLDVGALLFLYLMLLTRTNQPFWRSIGWREMRPGVGTVRESALQFVAGGAVLAILVSFVGGFLNPKQPLPIEELLKARVSVLLFGVLGVLVAPLVEETIFRGFLYPVVARQLGVTAGIAVTGTLFGLLHAAQLWGGWGQIALLIFVGVALTWVRAHTGTVAASYLTHLGYNGLQLVGYLIYVIGGVHRQ